MRILVTLDGSKLAERALAAIAPWAKAWGADVILLTVLDPAEEQATPEPGGHRAVLPAGYDTAPAITGTRLEPLRRLTEDRGQALESARIEHDEALQALAGRYLAGLTWTTVVLFESDAAEAIASFARENSIDFVAMSSRGRSGLGQAVFGSVASEVSRRLSVPAIIVGEQTALPGTAPIEREAAAAV